ncbi:MAG: N-acetylmuramoyl-L-alanine amidase [Patescibacteria group bacterium]
MKNIFLIASLIVLLATVLFLSSYLEVPYLGSALYYIAGPFFEERVTPEELRSKYNSGKIKVLLVPGHDNDLPGASFNGTKESDLNVEVGYHFFDFLSQDDKFEALITREKNGDYKQWLSDYVKNDRSLVENFREKLKSIMIDAIVKGKVKRNSVVYHNTASNKTSLLLYSINKWANENDIDIVLHIHFNDYPGRQYSAAGRYSGFSVYVPENQLPNARASKEVAKAIKNKLEFFFSKSDLPAESGIIIEDQELIAVGSNASRDGVSALIEYGYIYEPQFADGNLRPATMRELAFQTYRGVKNYFEPNKKVLHQGYDTTLLPYKWKSVLVPGLRSKDVLSLQIALLKDGTYPPSGRALSQCPISGYFGDCTTSAVKNFQEKYKDEILKPTGLINPTGNVNSLTLNKLNSLYNN